MSHLQGTDYVGSMVVVEDGARRSTRVPPVQDQAPSTRTTTSQPWRRCCVGGSRTTVTELGKPISERGKFQYPPQLLVVDGGKGQLSRAVKVLEELDLVDDIPVCALAKQFEEIYLPGRPDPVRLPRQSEALYLCNASVTRATGSPSRITAPCGTRE